MRESGGGVRSRCGTVPILPVTGRDFVALGLCANPAAGKGRGKGKGKQRC